MSQQSRSELNDTDAASQADSRHMDGVLASSEQILSDSDSDRRLEVSTMRDAFHGLQQKLDSLQSEVDELYDAKQTLEDCALDPDEADELRRFRQWAEPALEQLVAFRQWIEKKCKCGVVGTEPLDMTERRLSSRKRPRHCEEDRNVVVAKGGASENKITQFKTHRPNQH